jgi:ABC-type uncharacterized transport system substrate-binding protein
LAAAALYSHASPVLGQSGSGSEPVRVAILFAAKQSYRAAADAVDAALQAKGHSPMLIELPDEDDDAARERVRDELIRQDPTVVAAAGAPAAMFALQSLGNVPVVFFMVPNALDAPFMANDFSERPRVTGVTSDISPAEQVRWIRQIHPEVRSIAVLHSPRSKRTVAAIKDAAARNGIGCLAIEADRTEFPKAIQALTDIECDGVLMIPDSQVYNSACVQRLLLWGIRQKKPVWGFSEAVVKAGALAAQYPDSGAVGRQAAELVHGVIAGLDPAAIGLRYPAHVQTAVNGHTAKMIGVLLDENRFGKTAVRYGDDQ